MASDFWTDERVALLRQNYIDGLSAGASARQIGCGSTRNSVISKRHRMGLVGRASGKATIPRAKLRTKSTHANALRFGPERAPSPPYVPPAPDPNDVASMSILVVIDGKLHANDKLTSACCRWPCGDPQHADFGFCGQPTVARLPYCERHLRKSSPPLNISRTAQAPVEKELA